MTHTDAPADIHEMNATTTVILDDLLAHPAPFPMARRGAEQRTINDLVIHARAAYTATQAVYADLRELAGQTALTTEELEQLHNAAQALTASQTDLERRLFELQLMERV